MGEGEEQKDGHMLRTLGMPAGGLGISWGLMGGEGGSGELLRGEGGEEETRDGGTRGVVVGG